jgi:DNA-binding NtrC family response regulator
MPNTSPPQFPSSKDLVDQVNFDVDRGKVWFNEQRMILVHSLFFWDLRLELIKTLGRQRAKALIMRLGYLSGLRDAEVAKKIRPELHSSDAFMAGPQIALLKGMVNVSPVKLDFDLDKGSFLAEFSWLGAFEADLQIENAGTSDDCICWMLVGYSSGFCTYYMGRSILFKETTCKGTGSEQCHILGKPKEEWDDHEVLATLLEPDNMAEELSAMQAQLVELKQSVNVLEDTVQLPVNSIGESENFKQACLMLSGASQGDVTVLLQGETGVGKEIFARGLHDQSARASRPFVAVNCACIPPDLIEAELFGVEKGAYTGAVSSRKGKFERARGGTLFLDEIVELPPRAQAALLRAIQEHEIERVGGHSTIQVDVRLVTASHKDLKQAVEEGSFRHDLFYRLNVYPVHIPALRERKVDIHLLAAHFIEQFSAKYKKNIRGLSDKALEALLRHTWPGNVRELENTIERSVILTTNNNLLEAETLFDKSMSVGVSSAHIDATGHLTNSAEHNSYQDDLNIEKLLEPGFDFAQFENALYRTALRKSEGNITEAARLLGLTRAQFAYRMEKFAI